MVESCTSLPICSVLPVFLETLERHSAVVLTASPGAGKSTVVPLAVLEAGILGEGKLVMLEPRRPAARACAKRMAALRGERVGDTVGYQVRFDKKTSRDTRIVVMTEGVLGRRLIADPFLDGVSMVILDEFHERSVEVDLALAFLSELLSVRDDFRLVVMSATLDASSISAFLVGCPVVTCETAAHPISINYDRMSSDGSLFERALRGVKKAVRSAPDAGDVLVFMPGAGEIRRLAEAIAHEPALAGIDIVPLYGALPHQAQDRAIEPGPRRRIVLATNIAETSLTIPGVSAVVDSGLKKELRYDPELGLERLETVPISLDSAAQRAGRAGRLGPGWVLRLWSSHEEMGRPRRDQPEIKRVDPAPVLLRILAFGAGDPRRYGLLDTPDARIADNAMALLHRLGAVSSDGTGLTPRGRALAALPGHPRIGAMLLHAAELGVPSLGATVAALISERDIMPRSTPGRDGDPLLLDFEYRVDLLERFEKEGADRTAAGRLGISYEAASFVLKAKQQLLSAIGSFGSVGVGVGTGDVRPGALLLAGFPDRVMRVLKKGGREAVLIGGRGVRLVSRPPVTSESDLFIAVHGTAGRRGERSRSVVYQICPIERADLEVRFPEAISVRQRAQFDREKGGVFVTEETCFFDLVIAASPCPASERMGVTEALVGAALERWETVFKPSDAAAMIARIRFAASRMKMEGLPDVSEQGLKAMLPEICEGKRFLADIASADWLTVISSRLTYSVSRRLDEAFPAKWRLPSGRSVTVDYAAAGSDPTKTPVLACRLQELFGLQTTPAIAGGRIPLTLHLLAPNGRPCQVTSDLRSFWERTYADVRKDLRGRYPKHFWPEDPLSATPTHRAKPRQRG